MNKRKQFFVWVFIYFCLVSLDLASTFYISNELHFEPNETNNYTYEQNRAAAALGIGWWGLSLVLYGFWLLNSLLYAYHVFLVNPVDYGLAACRGSFSSIGIKFLGVLQFFHYSFREVSSHRGEFTDRAFQSQRISYENRE